MAITAAHRRFTPEMDAAIRSGYASRTRVADIAEQAGVSRNAVIGRARRLGLSRPRGTEVLVIDRDFVATQLKALEDATAAYHAAKRRVDTLRGYLASIGREDMLLPLSRPSPEKD